MMFSLRIKYAIQILSELHCYNKRGVRPSGSNLRTRCGFQKGGDYLQVMSHLRRGGWLGSDKHCYWIAVDLEQKTLYDLMAIMNEDIRIGPSPVVDWKMKNRCLFDSAIVLERELQTVFERKLKEYHINALIGATS